MTRSPICPWCRRRAGHDRRVCRMKRLHADPAFKAQQSARMKRLNADPAFKAKQSARMKRLHADPAFNPLAALSATERADYDVLKKAGYTRAEALAAIGRPHDPRETIPRAPAGNAAAALPARGKTGGGGQSPPDLSAAGPLTPVETPDHECRSSDPACWP